MPYRVTCIQSPEGDGTGTGGGCSSYSACALVDYGCRCAMRRHALDGATRLGKSYCSCGGIPPVVTPGGGSWDVGGGGGGGTSPPAAPAPRPITGVKCFPAPVPK